MPRGSPVAGADRSPPRPSPGFAITIRIRKPGSDRQVAAGTRARADGRYSTRALATRLGVSIATIHYWRAQGILPAIQELPGGPWWHEITPEVLERLRTHIRRAPVQPTAFDPQHFLVEGAL